MSAGPGTSQPPSAQSEVQQQFLATVAEVRPGLFRYCARMTGSVFDGEDIVQETLTKAHDALARMTPPPQLKAWLFRIAHNVAMDFLKRRERKLTVLVAEVPDAAGAIEDEVDPSLLDAALAVFVALPPTQRSALVLKDVLGQSLEQTAETMGTTVSAVKSALFRARATVAARAAGGAATTREPSREEQANLKRYADLFNARDWDGLRALLARDARLDLVSADRRRAAAPIDYYSRYAEVVSNEGLRAEAGLADGVPAIAVFRSEAGPAPSYFILLEWQESRVALIRDFRYVPYIASGASFSRLFER
jgi:RNA polymerase sigma-70 factor (ECF subfamily)